MLFRNIAYLCTQKMGVNQKRVDTFIHRRGMPWAHSILLIVSIWWTLTGIETSQASWKEYPSVALLSLLPAYIVFAGELLLVGADVWYVYSKYVFKSFFQHLALRSLIYVFFSVISCFLYIQTGDLLLLIAAVCASAGLKFEEIWIQNNIDRYVRKSEKGITVRAVKPKKKR